jgi:hypothetical protein
MASKIYAKGLAELLSSARHLEETAGPPTIKVALMKGTLAFNQAHDFWDDVSASIVSGTSAIALTNPAVTEAAGVVTFDAADTGLTWEAVTDADGVGSAVVFIDTGTAGTSPLVAFLDDTDLVANGSDVTLTFNASGIFTLNVA